MLFFNDFKQILIKDAMKSTPNGLCFISIDLAINSVVVNQTEKYTRSFWSKHYITYGNKKGVQLKRINYKAGNKLKNKQKNQKPYK